MTGTTYGIVAGYDGSPGAAQALRWAAREAWARGTTLTVCLAWTPDHMELPTESALCDLARQHGQELLTRGLPYAESVLGPDGSTRTWSPGPPLRCCANAAGPPRWWWSAAAGKVSCPACG